MKKLECEHCGNKFDTAHALSQHKNAKHASERHEVGHKSEHEKTRIKLKTKHLVAIFAVLIIVIAGYFLLSQKPAYKELKIHVAHSTGNENANVTVIEYSDFQCPACGYAEPVVKQLLNVYGDKIKFVYKHFPLTNIHPNAWKAAEASECADEQNKFWEYHDKLFENQNKLSPNDLKRYASELGLDTNSFNACLDSNAMSKYVQSDYQEGLRLKVSGTPTFLIDGQPFVGAQSFNTFKTIIDKKLGR